MELASRESIGALLAALGKSTHQPRRRVETELAARPVRNDRRRRCQCGQCRQCLEDQRWERIFSEKFADPHYYERTPVRVVSPLTSL